MKKAFPIFLLFFILLTGCNNSIEKEAIELIKKEITNDKLDIQLLSFVVDKQGVIQFVFDSQSKAVKHVEEAQRVLVEINK